MQQVHFISPSQALKDIFKCYHYVELKTERAQQNTGSIIQDGLSEFGFIKEHDISIISNGNLMILPQSFLIGKVEMPSKFVIPTTMHYLAIKIQPWATSFFFNNGRTSILDLSKTSYSNVEALHNSIFNSSTLEEKVKQIENFFLDKALPHPKTYEISKAICNYIYEKQGLIKIKTLLDKFPYSRQKLNQIFFEQTKNSIKEFSVYTRLRAIMSYRMEHPEESLTSITYKFGYFDQSHFIKDMKRVTGVTPSDFSKSSNLFFDQLIK
ncbi:helix-turn-helix domain-containing protein [Winogradskyella flava]|uniref:helix-turn-helix domain-containing protein n=1 Tax=Winogradskyella flava TaxID=1884876 RepID=UPI0024915998|nr:helix-turn-helix domain-containing protein [Winogradskyella flava]